MSLQTKQGKEEHRTTSPFVGITILLALATGLAILAYRTSDSTTQHAFQDAFTAFLPAFIVLGALLGIAVMALIVYGLAALWQGSKAGRALIEIVIIFFAIQGILHLLGW
jgi:hypothetical protein